MSPDHRLGQLPNRPAMHLPSSKRYAEEIPLSGPAVGAFYSTMAWENGIKAGDAQAVHESGTGETGGRKRVEPCECEGRPSQLQASG
jgi:hypothetical protein